MPRTWIRIYCDKWLEGTLREETLELRGAWSDLLAMAGSGKYSDTGQIKLTATLGYTDGQFADILGVPPEKWHELKSRLQQTDRILVEPDTNIITIINWHLYQPTFNRKLYIRHYMRDYRGRKVELEANSIALETSPSTPIPQVKQPFETTEPKDNTPIIIAALAQNYEKEIGVITPTVSEQLADFAHQYHDRNGPLPWITEAFVEAVNHNKRNWAYVRAILNAWLDQGKHKAATQTQEEVAKEWNTKQRRALQENSVE